MAHHYAYTNAKLNSPLQQKGNETMPTIEQTLLKTNTLTVTANKVDNTAASNAIALSIGKEIFEKKKNKKQKKKKIKMHRTTRRDLNCDIKLPKLIN